MHYQSHEMEPTGRESGCEKPIIHGRSERYTSIGNRRHPVNRLHCRYFRFLILHT